ncbi:MAG: uroporphyrinogen decarboxylase [Bacteroidota bacterium]
MNYSKSYERNTTILPQYKNDIFLRALKGEKLSRPPVWMMRQAGRYLPDFMKLKAKYSFFERAETPELATEITVMPIHQVGVDVAILFSDILVIPKAMGCPVDIITGQGPVLPEPIRSMADVDRLSDPDVEEHLNHVFESIVLTKEALNNEVPLIGFAGSPWTILCYMVQGGGSKNFDKAKQFCYEQPEAAHKLLKKITKVTISYLNKKIEMGVDTVQVFDSWGGLLSPADYKEFSLPYLDEIVKGVQGVPVILFAKGAHYALKGLADTGATALGLDWCTTPDYARSLVGNDMVLQGNFDPSRLLSPISVIEKQTKEMIDAFGTQKYIANLGHGILPNIPVDHAKAFVNAVKEYVA